FNNQMRDTTITVTIDSRENVRLKSAVIHAADSIEFRFNHDFSVPSLSTITVDNMSHHIVEQWKKDHNLIIRITPSIVLNEHQDEYVTLHGVIDVDQKPISIESVPLSRKPHPDDLLINEIMFNPLQARFDGGLDQSQYVEVYNHRPFTQFLPSLSLETSSASSTSTTIHHFDYSEAETISPYNYYIYKPDTVSVDQSRLALFFGLNDSTNYYKVHRTTLGFNSTAGSVWINHPQNGIIDS